MNHWTQVIRFANVCFVAFALSSCSGGSESNIPVITAAIVPTSGALQIDDTNNGQIDLTVTATGFRNGSTIFPVVSVEPPDLSLLGSVESSAPNQYTIHLVTSANLAPGNYSGNINLRYYTDSNYSKEYPVRKSFPYSISVGVADWTTFQRNASHTGFVNVTLDPTKFTKIWSWSRPPGAPGEYETVHGINSVATGAGKVFITKSHYYNLGAVYALNEEDGSTNWSYDLGRTVLEGPPAYANGLVYFQSTLPTTYDTATLAINAASGELQFKTSPITIFSSFFAPTVYKGTIFNTVTGLVESHSASNGSSQWSARTKTEDMTTPAVDDRYIYQYGVDYNYGYPGYLHILNKTDGSLVASIADPFLSEFLGYSMFSAPMIGSLGNVIAFSGGGFSGSGDCTSEQYRSRILVSYDISKRAYSWRSSYTYLPHPALANGIVYAGRQMPTLALDALSEKDGHVLWSWTPPAGNGYFRRNIVVTKNLVFVSTDANVYAIDLNTHQQVWQYPKPGMLAISSNLNLYIANYVEPLRASDGNLDAIRLK
jgi:outer membrane protein assembly factor BamB